MRIGGLLRIAVATAVLANMRPALAAGTYSGHVVSISYDTNFPNWFVFHLDTENSNGCNGNVVSISVDANKSTLAVLLVANLGQKMVTVLTTARSDGLCQVSSVVYSN